MADAPTRPPAGAGGPAARRRAGREVGAAVVLSLLGGGGAVFAGSQVWARLTVDRAAPLPEIATTSTGTGIEPLLTGLGVVVLAGLVGILATRRLGRVLVGIAVTLAGAGIAATAARYVAGFPAEVLERLVEASGAAAPTGVAAETSTFWPLVALAAGCVSALAGLLVTVRGRRWPGLGTRYEAPGAAPAAAAATPAAATDPVRADRQLWEALDRGDDPTVAEDGHPTKEPR